MPDIKPNISATGAGNRQRMGRLFAIVWIVGVVASIAFALPWWLRGLLAVPAAVAAIYLLQVRRMTCVVRAGEGVFEGDDLSTTPAPPADVAASRGVATGIWRDTILFGALGGAVAVATIFIR